MRTGHRQEKAADTSIRLAGFPVFCPMLFRPAAPARRDHGGRTRPALPARVVPLFGRYLFARFRLSDPWHEIRGLTGVDFVFGDAAGAPVAVPDAAVELIRSLCVNDCLYPAGLPGGAAPIAPGTAARVIAGPMADVSGICRWSDAKRVNMLMTILGRSVSVTARRSAVEPA